MAQCVRGAPFLRSWFSLALAIYQPSMDLGKCCVLRWLTSLDVAGRSLNLRRGMSSVRKVSRISLSGMRRDMAATGSMGRVRMSCPLVHEGGTHGLGCMICMG